MTPGRGIRCGLLTFMIGTGAFALRGDTPAVGFVRPTLLHHRHTPIKIHHIQDGVVSSTNWSGYAVTARSGAVTDVKGSWVVPAIQGSCPSTNEYASFWVGIDGYNSNTV